MRTTLIQFLRFAVVGVASNTLGFCWYLLLTWAGCGPKTAMSLLFLVGTLQTFVFNKRWSFKYEGPNRLVLLRYLSVYGLGYLVNLTALIFLVDYQGYSHVPVQAAMIVMVAILMFILQKYWVFAMPPTRSSGLA